MKSYLYLFLILISLGGCSKDKNAASTDNTSRLREKGKNFKEKVIAERILEQEMKMIDEDAQMYQEQQKTRGLNEEISMDEKRQSILPNISEVVGEFGNNGEEQQKPMTEPQDMPLPKQKNPEFKQVKDAKETQQDTIEVSIQIIKTANLNLQVADFKESTNKIRQIVKENSGYISSSNEKNNGYALEGEIVIRVLSKNFDKTISALEAIVIHKNFKDENAEDVTEEFVDIITRLKTKRQVEKRYLEILGRAKTIPEILEVEEKLRLIREEIEVKEGRLKYLKDQVGFSTIRLNYYQTNDKYEKPPQAGFFSKVGQAFSGGWEGLLVIFIGITYFWPLLLLIPILIWWWRKTLKDRHLQKQAIMESKSNENPEMKGKS